MLNHVITDTLAWTARSIDKPASWCYPLPEVVLAACPNSLEEPITSFEPTGGARDACAKALQPVREALANGRGFAIIEAPPTFANLPMLYWLVGHALGEPMAQNVQGTLLYDVRDTGQDLSKGARFSVTSYESSFHTDNSFGVQLADFVGLLCLQSAKSGGTSQVLSGYALHNELLARHPDVLATLYEPFHIDRRGGVNPGDAPTIQFPVIAWNGTELLFRYLRYWIEVGHEKAGQPLSAEQIRALNVLDECAAQSGVARRVRFAAGADVLHQQPLALAQPHGFRGPCGAGCRRHLLRLWLRAAYFGKPFAWSHSLKNGSSERRICDSMCFWNWPEVTRVPPWRVPNSSIARSNASAPRSTRSWCNSSTPLADASRYQSSEPADFLMSASATSPVLRGSRVFLTALLQCLIKLGILPLGRDEQIVIIGKRDRQPKIAVGLWQQACRAR